MNNKISQKTKKKLCNILGEDEGSEIYNALTGLLLECDHLRKSKVSITKLFNHDTSLMDYKNNDSYNRGSHG
jgi:hypothetical protein